MFSCSPFENCRGYYTTALISCQQIGTHFQIGPQNNISVSIIQKHLIYLTEKCKVYAVVKSVPLYHLLKTKGDTEMVRYTPPLGWNSWNTFGWDINEELIMSTADKMVEEGLLDAGYEYLVIDDCWAEDERDENGRLVPDRNKFPHGMKYIADYVHSKGLKFGMYSCDGYLTCAGFPASYQYEFIDAETFASWGVDFLKYDNCNRPATVPAKLLYHRMALALRNTGRDIMFSACNWGVEDVKEWIKETGSNMWRSTGDIVDSWESIKDIHYLQLDYQPYNGLGCFNDMDMLVVGMNGKGNVSMGGCTYSEYKTHFSLWCMLNSPLMLGCDIRNMSDETKKIVLNKDLIKINQDPAGCQPMLLQGFKNGNHDQVFIWAKQLENGDIAIGIFNLQDEQRLSYIGFDVLGLNRSCGVKLKFTDLWSHEEAVYKDGFKVLVPAHDCFVWRCKLLPMDD